MVKLGKFEALKGNFSTGDALEWSRLDFARRQKHMIAAMRGALATRGGRTVTESAVTLPLVEVPILFCLHAIPAAMGVSAARESVGQPFLRDHLALTDAAVAGPVHLIACHRGVTEMQSLKHLGFPDATVVATRSSVYVAETLAGRFHPRWRVSSRRPRGPRTAGSMRAMNAGLRFGEFDFDPESGELRRGGRPVPLQPQPARVLALLLSRPGRLVTRDEIRRRLWGDAYHVEFDQSINFSIRRLRQALGDDAGRPRWVETRPRLGYRFCGEVVAAGADPGPASPPGPVAAALPAARMATTAGGWRRLLVAAGLASLLVGVGTWVPAPLPSSPSEPTPPTGALSAVRPALPPAALVAYDRGLYWSRRDGAGNVERGIAELRLAVQLAPESAEPHAALAEALLAGQRYAPSSRQLGEADAEARRAVSLAPEMARAHAVRAATALQSSYDWDGAEAEYRTALRLDPGLAPAYRGYAALLAARGRFADAITAARRARELDPVCLGATADLAGYYFLARRYDEAIAAARAALALDPRDTLAHLTIIDSELARGDEEAALAQANLHLAAYFAGGEGPAPRVASLRAYWQGSVAYLSAQARNAYLPPSDLALLHLRLGDDDDALRLLLRSCQEHSGRDLLFAAVDPRLDPWRRDPRLHRVLACAGLDRERAI